MTDVVSNGTERCRCRLSDSLRERKALILQHVENAGPVANQPIRPRTPPGVGTPLRADGRPGWRHPHFQRRKQVATAVLLSVLIHTLAVGGALKYFEPLKPTSPALTASGFGRLMVDIVRQEAGERLSASPRIQGSRTSVARSFKAAASSSSSKRPPLVGSSTPVIESEQPQATASQPVEGLAFPQSAGLDAPGRRRVFVRPNPGPVGDQSLTEGRQRWELDRRLAQQVLLRQQLLHQYLGRWMAQLRPAVNQVADFVCQVGPDVVCEPTLPPEVQALVEQGMAQIQAINPASGPYRLVKTNGALSFDRVTS